MNNKEINDFLNCDFSSLSSFLSNISPLEFGTIGCLVGLLISIPLNSNEQNSIGNFLELVGQVILTVQAQQSINSTASASESDLNKFKEETQEKFKILLTTFTRLVNFNFLLTTFLRNDKMLIIL